MTNALALLVLAGTLAQTAPAPVNASAACSANAAVSGDLGFRSTECHGCSMTGRHTPDEPDIEFGTEPVLRDIERGGPGDGKLREGDALVALDGQLITTRAAAIHLSWLAPGIPVTLTVRRDGRLEEVRIVPAARCRVVTPARTTRSTSVPALIVGRSRVMPGSLSKGWLGLGLVCVACAAPAPGSAAAFRTFPEIGDVRPDSPAAQAGLQPGDVLLAVDGASLKTTDGASRFRSIEPNQQLSLLVLRGVQTISVVVTAASRP